MEHAQETPLPFDSRVASINSDRGSELRPDHKDQNNKGSVHKEARETPGYTRAATRPTTSLPTLQEVHIGQVQDVIMSVVFCDSVVHFSTSGPHEFDSQLFFSILFLAPSLNIF